jgi:hypothetical protein
MLERLLLAQALSDRGAQALADARNAESHAPHIARARGRGQRRHSSHVPPRGKVAAAGMAHRAREGTMDVTIRYCTA